MDRKPYITLTSIGSVIRKHPKTGDINYAAIFLCNPI